MKLQLSAGVLQLATPSTATLVFKTFDFPGWEVYVNGNVAQKSTHFPYGLLQTELPPGSTRSLLPSEIRLFARLAKLFPS